MGVAVHVVVVVVLAPDPLRLVIQLELGPSQSVILLTSNQPAMAASRRFLSLSLWQSPKLTTIATREILLRVAGRCMKKGPADTTHLMLAHQLRSLFRPDDLVQSRCFNCGQIRPTRLHHLAHHDEGLHFNGTNRRAGFEL